MFCLPFFPIFSNGMEVDGLHIRVDLTGQNNKVILILSLTFLYSHLLSIYPSVRKLIPVKPALFLSQYLVITEFKKTLQWLSNVSSDFLQTLKQTLPKLSEDYQATFEQFWINNYVKEDNIFILVCCDTVRNKVNIKHLLFWGKLKGFFVIDHALKNSLSGFVC